MRAIITGALILFFIVSVSHAEVYKWIDEKGTVHFTEDPETIPEKYREQAKGRTTEEDLMSIEERARVKQKAEEEIRKRLDREDRAYERSLKEEKLRRDRKEREYIQDQEKLRTEREQKIRKASERAPAETDHQVIKEPSSRQEKRVECSYCFGKGYKPCDNVGCYRGKIARTNPRGRTYYEMCPKCLGTGEKRCSECNGVGYVWRK